MPTYEITAPDGRKFRVSGNGSQEEALAQVQSQYQTAQPRQFVGPPVLQSATQQQPQRLSLGQEIKRTAGLGARSIAEGAMGVVSPFADAAGVILNKPLELAGANFRFPTNHSGALSQSLTQAGLPTPQGGWERGSNIATQLLVGSAASAPLTAAVMGKLGLVASPAQNAASAAIQKPSTATTPAARTLEDAGVALDRSQRTGGRFMQMLRGAVTNHPFTAERASEFAATQQRQFNRAVLRSIGAEADEATQPVMAAAKSRIGSIFNSIGSKGAQFDDALQSEIAGVMDDALRTVPQSTTGVLQRNVDDILGAVGKDGRISGEAFIKIRSHLSELSDNADVGQIAQRLERAMLGALERTHPGQKALLQDAVDQWRSMRIIQSAIGKGAERNISPLRLSNALGTNQNAAMSVYGQGGDQKLVALAQAGRSVLPQALPDSGTIPRGLMQAPLRAIATAPLYRGAQNYLMRQPQQLAPGAGVVRNAIAPAIGATNALIQAR